MTLMAYSIEMVGILILLLDVFAIASIVVGTGSWRHKLVWCLVVALLPVVGLVLYVIFGRSKRDRSLAEV